VSEKDEFRVLMCGDRNWTKRDPIRRALVFVLWSMALWIPRRDIVVIHGAARGADTIAGEIAEKMGFQVRSFSADWNRYGRAAGPIRNREMLAADPHVAFAFHSDLDNSKGTKDMVSIAEAAGVEVQVITG
jgi:hypothetical protein